MPRNPNIHKTLVIGSGPIVIGQAAEFDYAGTQACKVLMSEGIETVLVNSNPATIMTDSAMASKIYIEPLTVKTLRRIIALERPDSLLATLGGQTGLTLAMKLSKEGYLDKMGVKLLGATVSSIDKAEDRQLFKDTILSIGQPCIPSEVVEDVPSALAFAKSVGYPVIVRPAFTLGGSGGGIAEDEAALSRIAKRGLELSPIHQVLIESCVSGWKEIEFEVMRDRAGNAITICSMENVDPVGVHTGDSIVAAPALTLANKEYGMLRGAALSIISALEIEGGCNVQFALNPNSFEYAVIEVNPRLSRSSALASKATGYPIAKVAAMVAIGYTLDEIKNAVTGKTSACFEPSIDYVVVKFPKWPFDKFVYGKRSLGTQMKATGEVMAIAPSFEAALMKAVRGAEISLDTLELPRLKTLSDGELIEAMKRCDDERLFVIHEAILRGVSLEAIYDITKIDMWFLEKIRNLVDMRKRLFNASGRRGRPCVCPDNPNRSDLEISRQMKEGQTQGLPLQNVVDPELYFEAKRLGFTDAAIERLSGAKIETPMLPSYAMVDTCAGEFAAQTPYFYAAYGMEDEAALLKSRNVGAPLAATRRDPPTILVFGSGPIRIGQGIEFDYASVHCVRALQKLGCEAVIINNNPETVSTDFDTADRLYFEPLTPEDARGVIEVEKPIGAIVAFGGQTAIRLTKSLGKIGLPIIGTSADSIDAAEDRERFDAILAQTGIERPEGGVAMTPEEALETAQRLGYPVLLRPSYVLGGQNMLIAFDEEDVKEYTGIIFSQKVENPILIDRYLMGLEIEVDAICDGEDILIPGIMEHIERAGVHSGDSIAVYPARLPGALTERVIDETRKLALALETKGLINIQYVVHGGELYVIEANPRASRTVPYISKVTGLPMVELAVRCMFGEKLKDMGYGVGLYPRAPYVAVKVPVFSFEKLTDVDILLGPEMKSTGEVLGIGKNLEEALYKGLVAANYKMTRAGGVLLTVRTSDQHEIPDIARKFHSMGFALYATEGTAGVISRNGLSVTSVKKLNESDENTMTLLESGKVQYMLATSSKGRIPSRDDVKLRRRAIELGIPVLTSLDTANALANMLLSRYSQDSTELVNLNAMRKERKKLAFTKMQACGNDYLYFDCMKESIHNPESLSIQLCDRHFGVGADGVVLIEPSDIADARMRLFNLDGTEGGMGGNAIRCVGKYLYDTGIVKSRDISVETIGGVRSVKVFLENGESGQVTSAMVSMGSARFEPGEVPARVDGRAIDKEIFFESLDKTRRVTLLNVGNPHCVIFTDALDLVDIRREGSAIECDPLFPERANVEFVQVTGINTLKVGVWERGNGETLASGTAACAAAVAAVLRGDCSKGAEIAVRLPGGVLRVKYDGGEIFMTGDAVKVYEGSVEV